VCCLAILFSLLFPLVGDYYVDKVFIDTNYNMHITDQGYRKALDGRPIDQTLLEETIAAYRRVPMDISPYSLTEEYQTYARPYSEIFNLVRVWTGLDPASAAQWEPNEDALYTAMEQTMHTHWDNNYLTDSEIAYWEKQLNSLQTPFVYQYHDGYMTILEVFLTVGFMMLLYTAIALANVFPDEHTRRTDQLVLSSPMGRKRIYWVKLAAGITVGVMGALLMTLLTWSISLYIYGAEGYDAPIQLFYSTYAGNLTLGQACLIAYGCLMVTAMLTSVLVMFLSELLHSGIAALSVTTAMIVASALVQVPPQYRLLGQLWDYLPTSFLAMWNVFDHRLISLLGIHFTSYEIVPLIYIVLGIILSLLGNRLYIRYQVSGR
jgi:ABC-type transport system involved in multi-copper enzyme maturation permease subunit